MSCRPNYHLLLHSLPRCKWCGGLAWLPFLLFEVQQDEPYRVYTSSSSCVDRLWISMPLWCLPNTRIRSKTLWAPLFQIVAPLAHAFFSVRAHRLTAHQSAEHSHHPSRASPQRAYLRVRPEKQITSLVKIVYRET